MQETSTSMNGDASFCTNVHLLSMAKISIPITFQCFKYAVEDGKVLTWLSDAAKAEGMYTATVP